MTFTLLDPQTLAFLGLYFVVGLAIEGMLAAWIWERTALRSARSGSGWYLALGLAGCFVASHLVFAWAEARYYMPVTAFTRYLPLYYPLNARHTPAEARPAGPVAGARAGRRQRARPAARRRAELPAGAARRCEPRAPMLNVLSS